MENKIEQDWIYVNKNRRFRGDTHQVLSGRKWVTIENLETYLEKLRNEIKD